MEEGHAQYQEELLMSKVSLFISILYYKHFIRSIFKISNIDIVQVINNMARKCFEWMYF